MALSTPSPHSPLAPRDQRPADVSSREPLDGCKEHQAVEDEANHGGGTRLATIFSTAAISTSVSW